MDSAKTFARYISVSGFGATYIRYLTVCKKRYFYPTTRTLFMNIFSLRLGQGKLLISHSVLCSVTNNQCPDFNCDSQPPLKLLSMVYVMRVPLYGLSRTSGKLWQDYSSCYKIWHIQWCHFDIKIVWLPCHPHINLQQWSLGAVSVGWKEI